jgi:hypothetical protein
MQSRLFQPATQRRVRKPCPHRRLQTVLASACGLALLNQAAWAGQFQLSKTGTGAYGTIDSSAWVGNTSSPYGRAINNNSFEDSAITTFNGYQYTAYWKYVSGTGRVAVARRQTGTASWASLTLSPAFRSATNSNDAHDVVSLGIDPKDGTIHLAYDMHSQSMRYMKSEVGLATNPGATSWTSAATLFPNAEQSNLGGGGTISTSTMTYPAFVQTPGNDLQLFLRTGVSGNGSWVMYNYNGTSHAWDAGHQFDNGSTDTYTGTTSSGASDRSNYPNGFTYGPDGLLHSVFTYRESATGAANHDLNYVYSPDGGATWKNNAGTIVASQSAGTLFHLNSPGLTIRPLPQTQTQMNQNGQAVDHAGHIHSIDWRRDSAKDPSLDNTWEPNESSYFQTWRDKVGNWHENRLPGDVGSRPKILFDANDNAYAIYQVVSDTTQSLADGALYFSNGDLVISAATKASNWTDWKVVKVENGPFLTEAQADAELMASNGSLSILMQSSPTSAQTGNVGTTMKSFDYSLAFTPASTVSMKINNGDWSVGPNWNGSVVPTTNQVVLINNGSSATVSSPVPQLDNVLAIGAGGSAGSLNIAAGGSLSLLQSSTYTLSGNTSGANKVSYVTPFGGSIVVGRDGGAVGRYNQTGGNVSAWRFAVGDYYSESSGGGVSSATISGGSLTTYELDVAFSANGSSSGSSFNIAGGNVTVHGDAILGEFGNTATLALSSGTLAIDGDLREGFNRTNISNFRMDGGVLDMGGGSLDAGKAATASPGYIRVDNFIYNGGTILNVSTAPAGTNINTVSAATFCGVSVGTLLIGRDSATTMTVPLAVRVAAANRVDVANGSTLALSAGAAIAIGTTPSFTAGQVNVASGGTLAGGGTVAAPVNNSAGVVAPHHALTMASSFSQGAAGVTEIGLGQIDNDTLNITGAANLAGTLRLTKLDDTGPLPGHSYTVLNVGTFSGDVSIDNQTGHPGLNLAKVFTATELTIVATANLPGDANLDNTVNTLDFTALASHFGDSSANWLDGDLNGDGTVNALDFNRLASTYGSSYTPSGQRGALVPEPAQLFVLALFPLIRRIRNTCRLVILRRYSAEGSGPAVPGQMLREYAQHDSRELERHK